MLFVGLSLYINKFEKKSFEKKKFTMFTINVRSKKIFGCSWLLKVTVLISVYF